jgi:probable rRNA maturation factor
MIKINVIVKNISWIKYLKDPNKFIDKNIKRLNKKNKSYKKNTLICSLLLSGSKEIKNLNKKFRNKNKSTDVLSFPFYEKRKLKIKIKNKREIYLGDIIINLTKIKNKKDLIKFQNEFNKLWIHGLVHLFGHEHKKDSAFSAMSKIERRYLEYIN